MSGLAVTDGPQNVLQSSGSVLLPSRCRSQGAEKECVPCVPSALLQTTPAPQPHKHIASGLHVPYKQYLCLGIEDTLSLYIIMYINDRAF